MTQDTDHDLDDFLLAARLTPPPLPAGLSERVTADAMRVTADRARVVAARRPATLWHRLSRGLALAAGGSGFAGGMAAAAAAGVWIGLAQPAPVAVLESLLLSGVPDDEVADLIPSFDEVLTDADG